MHLGIQALARARPDPSDQMATSPIGVLAVPDRSSRGECASRRAGFHWGSGSQSWLARGSATAARQARRLAPHGDPEEQIKRRGSWTGSQRTPPNAVSSRTPGGYSPSPVDWSRHR